MTLNEQLEEILEIKNDIKSSIQAKGQDVSNFASYPDAIDDISAGTVRTPKTLLVMDAGQYDEYSTEEENCERQGEEETRRTDFYYPADEDSSILYIVVDYEGGATINYKNTSPAGYVDLDAALDAIYGSGTYDYTYLTGIDLVNYVNTLAATYDLTTEEYTENSEVTTVTFICNEDPGGGDEPEPEPEPEPDPEEGGEEPEE